MGDLKRFETLGRLLVLRTGSELQKGSLFGAKAKVGFGGKSLLSLLSYPPKSTLFLDFKSLISLL